MIRERIRQLRHAAVSPTDADFALAREWLPQPLLALFLEQHSRDIVHSANTARWLLDQGHTDRDLIAAALLHDIGKGQQRRRDRVAWVIAGHLGLTRVAADPGSRLELRRALARSATHSPSGADRLLAAGASPRVIDLTRRHHEPAGDDPMLALLQQADAAT